MRQIDKIKHWFRCWIYAIRFSSMTDYELNLMEARMRRDGKWSEGLENLFSHLYKCRSKRLQEKKG